MTWEAWATLAVVLATVAVLAFTRLAPDLVFVAALTAVLATGLVTPEAALSGLANPGLVTIAALFVVMTGLVETGALDALSGRLLGRPRSLASSQARLMLPVVALSAFFNNTPVVAMLVPAVQRWCRRHGLSPSSYMIPLSYAAILGGTCTLVGTSTNLIVYGLVLAETDLGPMGLFDIGRVGLPVALIGTLFVLATSRWLLRRRLSPLKQLEDTREYVIEMLLQPSSPLVGKTIEEAGLRHLPGAFVAEIDRGSSVIPVVEPSERLQAGDRLVFVGVVDSVADLVKLKGLEPAPDQLLKLDAPRPERRLIEAVVSGTNPVVGRTIRDGHFRSLYEAVVIAVARNGERLRGKVGDIVLRPGDTLLLEARPSFVEQRRSSRDFLLVAELQGQAHPRHEHAGLAVAILVGMVAVVTLGLTSMLVAALLAAGLMIASRCTTGAAARSSLDWPLLTVIAATLGLGHAVEASGLATAVAHGWLSLAGDSPWLALLAVYAITNAITAVLTNNAAAVLVFPVAQATAADLGVSLWPFVVTIMMAASASFATPISYHTNLMVYGPGGYRYADYLRIGLPLNVLLGLVVVLLVPLFWPF